MMSRISSSSSSPPPLILLLFLLCLSLLQCHGRLLNTPDHAMNKNHAAQDSIHAHIKRDEKDETIAVHDDLKEKHEMAEEGSMMMKKKKKKEDKVVADAEEKQTDSKSSNKKGILKGQIGKKTKGGSVLHHHHHHHHRRHHSDQKSLVTVTFRVPQKKKRVHDQQPGFNLDYSPPKTHPPSHN